LGRLAGIKSNLRSDLARFARMAFVRAADCAELIRRYWKVKVRGRSEARRGGPAFASVRRGEGGEVELLEAIYRWVRVPFTVWPME
jgi:hypothetical protein